MKRLILPGIAAGILLVMGCDGANEGLFQVIGVEPCVAASGQTVTIVWSSRIESETVTFNGAELPTTPTDSTRTKFTFKVPESAVPGTYLVANQVNLTVGSPVTVSESEPNDATNGSNATVVAMNRTAIGELSSVADKDHFRFDCMMGATYEITVSPRVVGQVFVDGKAVPLDAAGKGRFVPRDESSLIGLTGGTGPYTITVGLPSS